MRAFRAYCHEAMLLAAKVYVGVVLLALIYIVAALGVTLAIGWLS